jgi:hypothetical protein
LKRKEKKEKLEIKKSRNPQKNINKPIKLTRKKQENKNKRHFFFKV